MSEEKKMEALNEETLNEVAGGISREMQAAYDVVAGKYGTGAERSTRLAAAGLNVANVQHLVDGLMMGYGDVAKRVIRGDFGNGAARVTALKNAGYDVQMVQDIVNGILWDPETKSFK